MEFLQPGSWRESLESKAAYPEAVPLFGGTDVMVELNFDRERPEYLLDLTRVPDLRGSPANIALAFTGLLIILLIYRFSAVSSAG